MKSKTIKLVALTAAVFGSVMLAQAESEGQRSGERTGRKQCQKGEHGKTHAEQRENRKERFDKNDDGELGPRERKAMRRAKKRHQQQDETEA